MRTICILDALYILNLSWSSLQRDNHYVYCTYVWHMILLVYVFVYKSILCQENRCAHLIEFICKMLKGKCVDLGLYPKEHVLSLLLSRAALPKNSFGDLGNLQTVAGLKRIAELRQNQQKSPFPPPNLHNVFCSPWRNFKCKPFFTTTIKIYFSNVNVVV